MEVSNRNRTVKVGVISLLVLAIFLVGFIFYIIGSYQELFHQTESLYLFLPDIQGLQSGAFVTLAGLKVGAVGKLEFTQRDQTRGILVQLKVKRQYAELITKSSFATIKTMGVLGNKYVNIIPGSPEEPSIPPGGTIESKTSMSVEDVVAEASSAIDDFKGTLANLNQLSKEVLNGSGLMGMLLTDKSARDDIVKSLQSLRMVSDRILRGEGTAGRLVRDAGLYNSLSGAMANLDEITAKVQRGEGSLGKVIADTTFYARLSSISSQADSLLRRLQGPGTIGQLVTNEQLYNQLLELTRTLTELTEDIKKNPQKYMSIKVF